MAHQLNRHDVAAWLLRNGFVEHGKLSTSHRLFTHPKSGIKIVVPGHGPTDLKKKVAGNIIREICAAGFDRDRVRSELHGR